MDHRVHLDVRAGTTWVCGLAFAAVTGLAACGASKPVLYPNAQVKRVGSAVAERDIEECMRRAEEYGTKGGRGDEVARDVAVGGASGAAVGAVGGAITGNAGEGAAVGAATGATAGLMNSIFGGIFTRREPDPTYRAFVERCLQEKGYETIGWE